MPSCLRLPASHALLLLTLCGALPAPAQTVHVVGPGAIPQIQQAIALAAPGDVIQVQPGVYEPFTLDRALTIVSAVPDTVHVLPSSFQGGTTIFRIPGGTARVANLLFESPYPFYWNHQVEVSQGTVWFEDCLFEQGTHTYGGALMVRGSAVVLRRCWLIGSGGPRNNVSGFGGAGGTALLAQQSWVSATQTWFLGGDLHWDFGGHGGHGVEATGSALHLVRCTLTGGRNAAFTCAAYPAGHGLLVQNALGTWLADCTLDGGPGNCGTGGDGLFNAGPRPVELARCTANGGPGGTPGLPLRGPTVGAGLLGLGNSPGALVRGSTWTVDWRAAPGTPVFAVLSLDLSASGSPLVVQRTFLPVANIFLAGVVVTDANGAATQALSVPNVPALRHVAIWLHGHAGFAVPLQTAPPLGGVIR